MVDLEAENSEEANARLENIDELVTRSYPMKKRAKHPQLSEFLEEVALVADIDGLDESSNRVVLMTLHSAKGLSSCTYSWAEWRMACFPVI